jgi:uncharacterized protein YcbK (DUF882 family)
MSIAENGMTVRRRDLLVNAFTGLAGLSTLGRTAVVSAADSRPLAFYNLHTDEKLKVVYSEHGTTVPGALEEINHFLRDFRTGEQHPIDVQLLDALSAVYDLFERRGNFEVISGYRSPRTNAALRQVGSGVAKDSLHLYGRAIDVRLTSVATDKLRDAALALRQGGVGYYPKSNFVHIDTGAVRSW